MRKFFLLAFTLLVNLSLFADVSMGEKLETQRWNAAKDKKWDELDKTIAPYFQGANYDRVYSKENFLTFMKGLNLSDFNLSNFVVKEGPGILVITYDAQVTENINGNRMASKANRLSVWHKNNDKWILAAHAILIPVVPPK
jgi:hypothetical protein